MCDPGLIHICLYFDDAQAEYERLSALGMEFHCPPGGAGTMLATYGRDCDGNVVELLQVIAEDHPFPLLDARAEPACAGAIRQAATPTSTSSGMPAGHPTPPSP